MAINIMMRILCSALLTQLVLLPDFLYSQSEFYRGKTITIIHGRSAGGSGEYRARSVAPFLQKYIPGNPTIVHEHMDGAGGRKAANHIFNTARPDGLTIGSVGSGVVVSAVLGETGVQYDLDKLHFVGSPYSATHYVFLTRREAGLTTLDKLRQASGVRLGAQAVGHSNYTVGRIMACLLDLHVIFAVPRENKHPRFHNLPEIDGFAKTERERKVVTMFRNFSLTGSPFILPPAMPKDRVEIIKEALRKSFKDAAFFQEYRKLVGDDPTPLTPEASEKAIRDLPRDAESVELYKKFVGPGALPPR